MKCDKHKKDQVVGCMWCGRRLCEFCIARSDGKKYYCEKCVSLLGGVRREHLPPIKQPLPPAGRRLAIKDGYLELDGGR